MILKISHSTRYSFEQDVFLEPHYLTFTPAHRPYYDLVNFDLKVHPKPSGLVERPGLESNIYHQAWFNDMTNSLSIDVKLELKLKKYNPFEFFVDSPVADSNKEIYRAFEKEALSFYLQTLPLSRGLSAWSKEISESAGENLITYLSFLNQSIHSDHKHIIRMESNLMSPDEVFSQKTGSCRDLSWMMIHILRHRGIAARFVSGYSFNPELEEGHELHAWVEAYLPGGGWIGLDPSAGIFTTETYIPISASFDPDMTKPVIGGFRGKAKSTMETAVDIELVEE